MRHLQDTVAQFLIEHHLSIGRHVHQDLVELELAGTRGADHPALAQQVDEILEQRPVKELRRIE